MDAWVKMFQDKFLKGLAVANAQERARAAGAGDMDGWVGDE